jgi:hypothetical protein
VTVCPLDPAVIATDRGADRPTSAEDILDLLDALRPAWHAQAACRGQTDVMFPVSEPGRRADTSAAQALCERCPVQAECADAGRTERYGVWGAGGSGSGRMRQRVSPVSREYLDLRNLAIRPSLALLPFDPRVVLCTTRFLYKNFTYLIKSSTWYSSTLTFRLK